LIQRNTDINPKQQGCSYLVGSEPKRCGRGTKFKVVLDEDMNKIRDYDHLCPEHREKVGGSHW